jgi:hypothetical protein
MVKATWIQKKDGRKFVRGNHIKETDRLRNKNFSLFDILKYKE